MVSQNLTAFNEKLQLGALKSFKQEVESPLTTAAMSDSKMKIGVFVGFTIVSLALNILFAWGLFNDGDKGGRLVLDWVVTVFVLSGFIGFLMKSPRP